MDESVVNAALFERYFAPTMQKRDKYIGVEIEMPVINLSGKAVDFSVIHKLTSTFAEQFRMMPVSKDDEGHICSLQNNENGDDLSYDCSYNNLELSMGKEKDINRIAERFFSYYEFIEEFFSAYNYTLTGLGINPFRKNNLCIPILNERYRMLFHYLGLYEKYSHPDFFHKYPDFGTFASASQVQIDVDYDDIAETVNVFTKLEPIKALLFSNSAMPGEENKALCVRDMFWENSMHGINPRNVGMYDREFKDAEDLFEYIKQTSIYCTMRNGRYINFFPIPLLEYFLCDYVTGEFWNGNEYESIIFRPEIGDLRHHRTFKYQDLTYRGTIEYRSCCCQPISDSMTVAAFHVGLSETLGELRQLLERDHILYNHGLSTSELRKAFCRGILPNYVNDNDLQDLVLSVLDLSRKGLEKRGLNEQHFLAPLYERALRKSNPALDYLQSLENGLDVSEIIISYAKIDRVKCH